MTSELTSTNAQLVIMFVNHLLSVSTNTWVLTNKSTAVTVTKVPCQTTSIIATISQDSQVLSSHVNRSMNVKSVLTDTIFKLTASTQHVITPMVATWIPMFTVHQVMTANVTPITKLIQTVSTPTQIIKDPSVLISMNALLEHITVTNMPNATLIRTHLHAHVRRDGLVAHMVQDVAQITMNVPTVFKPSHPLPVAGEKNQRLENSADLSGVCPNW